MTSRAHVAAEDHPARVSIEYRCGIDDIELRDEELRAGHCGRLLIVMPRSRSGLHRACEVNISYDRVRFVATHSGLLTVPRIVLCARAGALRKTMKWTSTSYGI